MSSLPSYKTPKLSLVGAGPGDPDLITLKGIKALQQADVILYDALVNEELLDWAPKSAPRIFVGKRAGNHAYTQDQINNLIVDFAYTYGHVVRLKGGDSFVFGRGHEELAYAAGFNIETTVVPGISSSIAVPELQHIPLTKRGINESFWVITATTSTGALSKDIFDAAQSDASVIILMGTGKLGQIAEIFADAGKKDTPVAVIQNGSLPDERIAIGTVADIAQKVKEQGIGAPAIILIGEVVSLHPSQRFTVKDSYFQ